MPWWPGKNIGRPQGGWIKRGLSRQAELKERGMNVPQPELDPAAMQGAQGAAGMGAAGFDQARGMQGDTFGMYQDMAQGNGPSLAQAQLAQSGAQTVADQQAMAAQARGGNLAAQARQAQGAGAAAQMGNAQQMAALQAQEQQAAMAGMAGMSNQMAGQSLQQQMGGLGLQNQLALGQLDASTQWGLGQRGLDIEQLNSNRGLWTDIIKSGAGAAGMALGVMSDERRKLGLAPSGGEASEALARARPSTYAYEPGAGPPGEQVGPTAQGLAQTSAGASAVRETPAGLMVDPARLATLTAAAAGEQEPRLARVEAALGLAPKQTVDDAQGRSFGVEPGALERQAQEQDMLRKRVDETEAILQAKLNRGEDGSAELAELERLSTFMIDPTRRDPNPYNRPDATLGPFRGLAPRSTAELPPDRPDLRLPTGGGERI